MNKLSDAWSVYWQGAGSGTREGCLPNAAGGIGEALREFWAEFARDLPPGAKILDLATGSGSVLKAMQAARSGLALHGVDAAPVLPPAPRGIKLLGGVAMEALPFPAGYFDAVTSQFGIEYGNRRAAAGQVKRMLRRGGRFRAIIHCREGPVLRHNLARREALCWAAAGSGYLAKARRLAEARRATVLPTPVTFRQAVDEARRRYPRQPVAAEFTAAILQALETGGGTGWGGASDLLTALEAKARNETARIDLLEQAAVDRAGAEAIAHLLSATGLAVDPVVAFKGGPGEALAWSISAEAC